MSLSGNCAAHRQAYCHLDLPKTSPDTLCLWVCVFLHMLHIQYQNTHSTAKWGQLDVLSGPYYIKGVWRLRLGFKVEVRNGFRLRSWLGFCNELFWLEAELKNILCLWKKRSTRVCVFLIPARQNRPCEQRHFSVCAPLSRRYDQIFCAYFAKRHQPSFI